MNVTERSIQDALARYTVPVKTLQIIFGCIFGLVIWLVIIYNIIASATRSKRIKTLLMFQARILKETTVKDGIPEEKIKELIDNLKRMHPEISI